MRYSLTIYYRSDEQVIFDLPLSFRFIGQGLNLETRERDWQIEGASIGEAVRFVVSMCNRLVSRGVINVDYRVEINPILN
jgi:hypothetical protein